MKWLLRIIILISLASWAIAGWMWRDEIRARVAEWQGTQAGQALVNETRSSAENTLGRVAGGFVQQIDRVQKEVKLPEPIRVRVESPKPVVLTVSGIVAETNAHRRKQGLGMLKLNAALSHAATAKAQDMLERQYFAHDAPDGVGAADIVESAGYQYVTIGENLALGNYANDAVLAQAWMDSPGHRENILNGRFTEIGVGVAEGAYEGEKTWMAVQEFGKPLSDCPAVDDNLQKEIQQKEAALDALGNRIEILKAELDRTRPQELSSQEEVDAYNGKIDEYNRLVAEHNRLRDALQNLISRFNSQIRAHNACLQQGSIF